MSSAASAVCVCVMSCLPHHVYRLLAHPKLRRSQCSFSQQGSGIEKMKETARKPTRQGSLLMMCRRSRISSVHICIHIHVLYTVNSISFSVQKTIQNTPALTSISLRKLRISSVSLVEVAAASSHCTRLDNATSSCHYICRLKPLPIEWPTMVHLSTLFGLLCIICAGQGDVCHIVLLCFQEPCFKLCAQDVPKIDDVNGRSVGLML